jgi:hypothetical protein
MDSVQNTQDSEKKADENVKNCSYTTLRYANGKTRTSFWEAKIFALSMQTSPPAEINQTDADWKQIPDIRTGHKPRKPNGNWIP